MGAGKGAKVENPLTDRDRALPPVFLPALGCDFDHPLTP